MPVNYFVTGGTGFVGRHLISELLDHRRGKIFVLCRRASLEALEQQIAAWRTTRVQPVIGDLTEESLGVAPEWVTEHQGSIRHFFHIAASYDMEASEATNLATNVDGTANALDLASALQAGTFHHVSSVAVAGNFRGVFDETMFDEGQTFPTSYHRTKFEAERIVREQDRVPWRIYRPSVIVGHSVTGEMDKVDGPYYTFPALKAMRDLLPTWTPLVGVDLGDTNIVPVDHVAAAMDHLAHRREGTSSVFHLVNPEPQGLVEMTNTFAEAARAPRFALPLDRAGVARLGLGGGLRPVVNSLLQRPMTTAVLHQTLGRLGIPAALIASAAMSPVLASRRTQEALAGTGIEPPALDDYAETLWTYWEEVLDDAITRDEAAVAALGGTTVVITGASSGIGFASAAQIAKCGATVVLVARNLDRLDELAASIRRFGGTAATYACDLTDFADIDRLVTRLAKDFDRIDYVVNNAGRSIRRSIELSGDRFHDFERTMQLNYFGTIRLMMGLLPRMREQGGGHLVNVSSVGVLGSPPRFSAYVASKAALDAWTNIAASEAIMDGVTFTTIHMPLVRTPMISPTKAYNTFSTISPGQAAAKVIQGLVERPREINTITGTTMALIHKMAPTTALRMLNVAYQSIPEAGARPSQYSERTQRVVRSVYQKLRW